MLISGTVGHEYTSALLRAAPAFKRTRFKSYGPSIMVPLRRAIESGPGCVVSPFQILGKRLSSMMRYTAEPRRAWEESQVVRKLTVHVLWEIGLLGEELPYLNKARSS